MSKQRDFEAENDNARSWKRKRTLMYVRPAKVECYNLLSKSGIMQWSLRAIGFRGTKSKQRGRLGFADQRHTPVVVRKHDREKNKTLLVKL